MSFAKLSPNVGGRDYLRLEEVIDMHKWPDNEWSVIRFLPTKIVSVKQHWIGIITSKAKKRINLPRWCLAHDVETGGARSIDGKEVECIYCTLKHGNDQSGAPASASTFFLANAIIREIQEDEPRKTAPPTKEEKRTGFKNMNSKAWTPVRVVRLTNTMVARVQELSESNRVKNKKKGTSVAYDVTDAKHGMDIRVRYKPKAAGSDKYSIDADEKVALDDTELAYLTFQLDESILTASGLRTEKEALDDFKDMDIAGGDTPDDDDEDDEDSHSLGGKKKKSKSKKAFDDGDEDDEDEDEAPRKKKKKAAFDDDDEDDEPVAKKKKKKKPAFDDDEDDEDEAPVKKKKKKVADEAPVKKKKKKVADEAPAKKKKKKPAFDDDDGDDEPDEFPRKKKKAKR